MERVKRSAFRQRRKCVTCNQFLSYSAWNRHRNTRGTCPGASCIKVDVVPEEGIISDLSNDYDDNICNDEIAMESTALSVPGFRDLEKIVEFEEDEISCEVIGVALDEIIEETIQEEVKEFIICKAIEVGIEETIENAIQEATIEVATEEIPTEPEDPEVDEEAHTDSETDSEADSDTECSESGEVPVYDSDVDLEEFSESQHRSSEQETPSQQFITFFSFFMNFFQLCYRVSDRGITIMLAFFKAMLQWIAVLLPPESRKIIKDIADQLPSNVYYLKKASRMHSNSIKRYVVCPSCCALYEKKDFEEDNPKCSAKLDNRKKCNTYLLKTVKHGSKYKLIPKRVYAYNPVKSSLSKLFSRNDFIGKCELWRKRQAIPGQLLDVYDGRLWKESSVINGKPFLQNPNNLCLKLNVDWIQPYDHVQYSMGIIYLVIENLPRQERFKPENIIAVGCIPGPKEPRGNINSFLKPLVDELLELWSGVWLKTNGIFGYTSVRCMLSCISSDLPATRKACGFAGHSASKGCSKCYKTFKSGKFADKKKLDYSGYNRASWPHRTHQLHLSHVSEINEAKTITEKRSIRKKYGARYSELLRLPYIDIVRYHCIDVMHNLLLGTAKHMMTIWKDIGLLKEKQLEALQDKIDAMEVPAKIGRIPTKIYANGSSLTADQWRNWACIFSLYALHDFLPAQHYNCWVLFSQACIACLQPSITLLDLKEADSKLILFCKEFEILYGKEKCTPNMHLHSHIIDTILDYGPVYATWCFAFERFNGIFQSFQKNWIYPEVQLLTKFLNYQNVSTGSFSFDLPCDVMDVLQLQTSKIKNISLGQGSSYSSHINSSDLFKYSQNTKCELFDIDARESDFYSLPSKRFEYFLSPQEVAWLKEVYETIYPTVHIAHVPMICESFNELEVIGENFVSTKSKGSASCYIIAKWAGSRGQISSDGFRVGKIVQFIKHEIATSTDAGSPAQKRLKTSHIFAKIEWHKKHPRESHLPSPLLVTDIQPDNNGPATFIPLSRIHSRCAVVHSTLKFDFGQDSVLVAVPLKRKA